MNDLISRQDAKSKKVYSHERHEYVVPVAELDWLPSAQQERKKGKWIFKYCVWFCSECGDSPTKGMGYVQGHDELYDFCPHCGADMRERKES